MMTTAADKNDSCFKNREYICGCGKIYKHRQSLHSHSKKCASNNVELSNKEIILKLFNDNQDFKKIIIEQSKQTNY
jgi:hypothetical protein